MIHNKVITKEVYTSGYEVNRLSKINQLQKSFELILNIVIKITFILHTECKPMELVIDNLVVDAHYELSRSCGIAFR